MDTSRVTKFTDPSGQDHFTDNIRKFARDHDLDPSHLVKVANGTRKSHKGWSAEHLEKNDVTAVIPRQSSGIANIFDPIDATKQQNVTINIFNAIGFSPNRGAARAGSMTLDEDTMLPSGERNLINSPFFKRTPLLDGNVEEDLGGFKQLSSGGMRIEHLNAEEMNGDSSLGRAPERVFDDILDTLENIEKTNAEISKEMAGDRHRDLKEADERKDARIADIENNREKSKSKLQNLLGSTIKGTTDQLANIGQADQDPLAGLIGKAGGFFGDVASTVLGFAGAGALGKGAGIGMKLLGKGGKGIGKLLGYGGAGIGAGIGIGQAAKLGGEGVSKLGGMAVDAGKGTAKLGGKATSKLLGKGAAKMGAKALPWIGGVASLGFAADAIANGDLVGAGLEGASAALNFTGLGALPSIALDGYIMKRDYDRAMSGDVTGLSDSSQNLVQPQGDRMDVKEMSISQKGIDALKTREAFREKPYKDPYSGDWTIGYGTTIGKTTDARDAWLKKNAPSGIISESQATGFLMKRIKNEFAPAIKSNVKVPLNQNEYDALVSFVYNIGGGKDGFEKSQTLTKLNEGNYEKAAALMLRWRKAGNDPTALENRRVGEVKQFLGMPASQDLSYNVTKDSVNFTSPIQRQARAGNIPTAARATMQATAADTTPAAVPTSVPVIDRQESITKDFALTSMSSSNDRFKSGVDQSSAKSSPTIINNTTVMGGGEGGGKEFDSGFGSIASVRSSYDDSFNRSLLANMSLSTKNLIQT